MCCIKESLFRDKMENNVVFDEQIKEMVKKFLLNTEGYEEKSANELQAPCAEFMKKEFLERIEDPKYLKGMLKEASKSLLEEENRKRRNLKTRESRNRRKAAQRAAQLAPQLAPPLPRGASGCDVLDVTDMLDMVLPLLTLQEAGRFAGTCRKMADIVRDPKRTWKPNVFARKIDISLLDHCYPESVHYVFSLAYAFYRQGAVSPYADWLVNKVCRHDASARNRWEVFRCCIMFETRKDEEGEDEMWILQPNTRSQIIAGNMEELNRIIEKNCLEAVSPSCWQEWKPVPTWCELVKTSFCEWRETLPFQIDENRINRSSMLAKLSESAFKSVKSTLDDAVNGGELRNWNHFAYKLLIVCHNNYEYRQDEEYNDDDNDFRWQFERDKGDDYEQPYFPEYTDSDEGSDEGSDEDAD
jgi:hypothetical protein